MASATFRAGDMGAASPTLDDVAMQAGVSTATVSRCLNSPKLVSEATRVRVMQAVDALGYAPNFSARALASRRTDAFGAVVPTMDNAIFARALQAFQEELGRNGVTLLVASSSYDPALEERQIRALVARGADALLLIGHDRTPESYAFLAQRRTPFVNAWVTGDDPSRPSVGFDNRAAMKSLTQAVLERGHRRLGLISGPTAGNDRARARLRGAHEAAAESGLPPEALDVIETPYSIENGARAFAELIARAPRPTAILCGNDVLAAGALTCARSLGLEVPGDVSITGFDDIDIADIVTPGLTTVHVPHRKMGRAAAHMLLAMRNDDAPGAHAELAATLVWRDSLGPAPQG